MFGRADGQRKESWIFENGIYKWITKPWKYSYPSLKLTWREFTHCGTVFWLYMAQQKCLCEIDRYTMTDCIKYLVMLIFSKWFSSTFKPSRQYIFFLTQLYLILIFYHLNPICRTIFDNFISNKNLVGLLYFLLY